MDLEGCGATNLEGLTDDFDNLSSLSLANNKLTSLKSFPAFKTLSALNLKDNQLDGGFDNLSGCTQLKSVDLTNNNITSAEQLSALKSCAALETITLVGCPIASTDDYRTAVFSTLPQVTSVDGVNRGSEHHAEGENGTHKNGKHTAVNGEGDATNKEAGVDQLLRDDLEDDDEEYNPEGEEEEDDDDIDEDDDEDGEEEGDFEEEDSAEPRGVKRKHEDADPVAHAEDNSANGTQ